MTQKAAEKTSARKNGIGLVVFFFFICAIPIALIVLYYISLTQTDILEWANLNIAAPYRSGAATVTSFGPFKFFSVFEILLAIFIIGVLYYIVKTIILLVSHPHKFFVLGHRLLTLIIVGLYLFAAYSWLWAAGYHTKSLSTSTGIGSTSVSVAELTQVTTQFAQNANKLSTEVKRDTGGHFNESSEYYFELAKGLYANISAEIPQLGGAAYTPKSMIFSPIMSIFGFTGVYIALTGEANVNTSAPACLIPATIAHEMAHQRGVNAEDEANFAGIAACITSNITDYEYSGYLLGLIYLGDALAKADPSGWSKISATLNAQVLTDWKDNSSYWEKYKSPATTAASAVYDGYLKSNGESLGINSYGACVDMLAAWSLQHTK